MSDPAAADPVRRDPVASDPEPPDPLAVAFVLRLGRALHSYGYSAARLEDGLGAIADRLGMRDHHFFTTPTSIMASFGPLGHQRTHMLRVQPGEVSLGKLADVEQVSHDVATGTMSPADGSAAIVRIEAEPPPYGAGVTTIAYGLASGAACQLLGGGPREILVATVLGLGLGVLALVALDHQRLGRVFEPLAAFLASAATLGLAQLTGPLSTLTATLGGLIVLVPGLTLTTAMQELATRHLAAGTARLSGAFITFISIAFGVALGGRVGATLFGATPSAAPATTLPGWAGMFSLLLAPLAFTVILRAAPRDAPWIVLSGALGVAFGRLGAATLGVELGTFAGALAVALASSAYERWRHRPSAVVMVPGILLLVPGSVGFRSLSSMLDRHALAGIETAFSMILTAVALVAGLLIANVLAPEPRLREVRGS